MNKQKICIIGDGLAGLSTALILSQENIEIDLYGDIAKKNTIKKDNRTIAISESNFQFIKNKIKTTSVNIFWPCKEINLFFEDNKKIKSFLQYRKRNLMYIFKNKELKKELDIQILAKKNIKLIKKKINAIDYNNGSKMINKKIFYYDLIILCVGGHTKLYNKITQGRSIEKNYKEISLTTTIQHSSKINTVSQFFLNEGPLAILPFSKKNFSIVWSVSNLFFHKNKKSLKKILRNKIISLLQNLKIKKIDEIHSYPIKLNLKTRYYKKNILILGDGLHSVHPMAGQGFNLVLRDIKKLSELVTDALKIGLSLKTSFVLKDFYQARKPENTILGLGINITNMFFKDNKYFSPIRKRILENISNSNFIKKISQRISDKGISS
jgi:2-octaprenyl-6-methoxyphenol hydroxylase